MTCGWLASMVVSVTAVAWTPLVPWISVRSAVVIPGVPAGSTTKLAPAACCCSAAVAAAPAVSLAPRIVAVRPAMISMGTMAAAARLAPVRVFARSSIPAGAAAERPGQPAEQDR